MIYIYICVVDAFVQRISSSFICIENASFILVFTRFSPMFCFGQTRRIYIYTHIHIDSQFLTNPVYMFMVYNIYTNTSLCTHNNKTIINRPPQKHTMHLKKQRKPKKENLQMQLQTILSNQNWSFQLQKHPRSFFGALPVARYFAAVSSALRRSSPCLASIIALFSSAALWIRASLFFIFSTYCAFFFSNFSCTLFVFNWKGWLKAIYVW